MDSLHISEPSLVHSALRARALEEGYLHCPSVIDPQKIAAARDRVLEGCARRGWLDPHAPPIDYHHPDWVSLQAELLHGPALNALRTDESLHRILRAVIGNEPRVLHADVIRIAFPHAAPTPPHQDAHYLRDESIWIAWLPLDETPLDRGPLAVIPGSHCTGLRPHLGDSLDALSAEPRPDDRWHASPLAPGDLLLFQALTVHRALPNQSSAIRLSVDYRFR
jgi:ectoine hydroxylase-related dioxygenase (phytanoyl-CoA dioxygenase family)